MMADAGLRTFIGQAAAGYIAANFALIVARILLVPRYTNEWFVFWLPLVFVVGLVAGAVVGVIIWLWDESIGEAPNMIFRTIIGVAISACGPGFC
jgi:hypothetical protein